MSTRDDEKDKDAVVAWGNVGWDDERPRARRASGTITTGASRREKKPAPEPDDKPSRRARRPEVPPDTSEAHARESDTPREDEAATTTAAAKSGPLVGRGLLMLCAAGYLFVVAWLCYEALGTLHREAATASGAQLAALAKTHATVTMLLLANAGAGALFVLASLLLLTRRAGLGKVLLFFAVAFLVGFLYLHFKEASATLRELDLLAKMAIVALGSMSLRG